MNHIIGTDRKTGLRIGGMLCAGAAAGLWVQSVLNSAAHVGIFLFSAVTAVLFLNSVYYAVTGYEVGEGACEDRYSGRYKLLTVCAVLLVYMPLWTKGFFFHDDYLNFTGVPGGHGFYEFTITQGRQMTGIFTDFMNFVTPDTSMPLRMAALLFLIVYMLTAGNVVYHCTRSNGFSAFISTALVLLLPVVNVSAYGSMFCYPLAFLFGGLGVCYFRKAVRSPGGWGYFLVGALYIIFANFVYQAVANTAFLFVLLYDAFDKKQNDRWFIVKMTVMFVLATGVYYISMKMLAALSASNVMGRGAIISTPADVLHKITWFRYVVKECIKQLAVSILGGRLVVDAGMYADLRFWIGALEVLVVCCGAAGIVGMLVTAARKNGVWGFLQTAALLPLAYYVFLLLKEDSYASYYAVALCSVLLIMCIVTVVQVAECLPKRWKLRRLYGAAALLLLVAMGWNSNRYMQEFWVESNAGRYALLKQGIESQYTDQNRIHVVGALIPGQADVYAKAASQLACRELGIEPEGIVFTSSSHADYAAVMGTEVFDPMVEAAAPDDRAFLEAVYHIDRHFSLCTLRGDLTKQEIARVSALCKAAGIIPGESDNAVLVDLT